MLYNNNIKYVSGEPKLVSIFLSTDGNEFEIIKMIDVNSLSEETLLKDGSWNFKMVFSLDESIRPESLISKYNDSNLTCIIKMDNESYWKFDVINKFFSGPTIWMSYDNGYNRIIISFTTEERGYKIVDEKELIMLKELETYNTQTINSSISTTKNNN
jgi:hypothetical protein